MFCVHTRVIVLNVIYLHYIFKTNCSSLVAANDVTAEGAVLCSFYTSYPSYPHYNCLECICSWTNLKFPKIALYGVKVGDGHDSLGAGVLPVGPR